MKRFKDFDDPKKLDEAQVQVAGKKKPSGAHVLATVITKELVDKGLFPKDIDQDQFDIVKTTIEQVILDSTF